MSSALDISSILDSFLSSNSTISNLLFILVILNHVMLLPYILNKSILIKHGISIVRHVIEHPESVSPEIVSVSVIILRQFISCHIPDDTSAKREYESDLSECRELIASIFVKGLIASNAAALSLLEFVLNFPRGEGITLFKADTQSALVIYLEEMLAKDESNRSRCEHLIGKLKETVTSAIAPSHPDVQGQGDLEMKGTNSANVSTSVNKSKYWKGSG